MRKILGFLFVTVFFSACVEDVYDPVNIDEVPKEPAISIDWSTTKATKLSVVVDDEYDGKYYYTVEAYTGNPAIDPSAKLIAGSGQKTNSKVPYNREISLPESMETLFVMVTDPFMRKRVYATEAKLNTINITLGVDITSKAYDDAATLRADEEEDEPEKDMDLNAFFAIPDTYKTIGDSENITMKPGDVLLIPAGQTYTGKISIDGSGKAKIYVQGTWDMTNLGSNIDIQNGTEIYVLNGGKIVNTNSGERKFSLKQTSFIAIAPGGVLGVKGVDKIALSTTNDSRFMNWGNVYISNVNKMTDNSTLLNYNEISFGTFLGDGSASLIINRGKFTADDATVKANLVRNYDEMVFNNLVSDGLSSRILNRGTITANSASYKANEITNYGEVFFTKLSGGGSSGIIYNYGKFIVDGTDEINSGKIYNFCYMEAINTLKLRSLEFYNEPGAYLKFNTLLSNNMKYYLKEKSMVDGVLADFNQSNTYVAGGTSDYALFKVDEIKTLGWINLHYSNKLEVACQGSHGLKYDATADVFFSSGEAVTTIAPDECNGNKGNNNEGEGDGDTDPGYEEEKTLSYLYLFEDNWPNRGDYDMNDLVISVEINNITEGERTVGFNMKAVLYAAGGTLNLGVGFQLDGIPASNLNDTETDQSHAVIKLFDNAHAQLGSRDGIQANSHSISFKPKVIERNFVFNTPINGTINPSNFNLFIVPIGPIDNLERKEIHLPGFLGTDRATLSTKCTPNYIHAESGWMWGLCVPLTQPVTYPIEGTPIEEAYEGFTNWVEIGEAPTWYFSPISGKVIVFDEDF